MSPVILRQSKCMIWSGLINCFPATLPSRADHTRLLPDQSKQLTDQSLLCLLMEIQYISDPSQMDLTSNFFVLCTNMKVNLYNDS